MYRLAERYLRWHYKRKLRREWGKGVVPPEWFDHRIDLFLWAEKRVPFWVERGVFSRAVMSQGDVVLDMCCGDGFYSHYFYSGIASCIDAVDNDEGALRHARRWHSLPNISYVNGNVVTCRFPQSCYNVIVWDGAIEHFAPHEISMVLEKCSDALVGRDGILCGYTIIPFEGWKSHPDHEYEFHSAEELRELLLQAFPFAATFETRYPMRHNLYFRAGFDPGRLAGFVVEANNSLRCLDTSSMEVIDEDY